MHPLAAPGTLWVLSSDGKYLVRPQADETSHKKLIPCGRQGKRASLLFSVSQRISPLRRRPKGFPVALWKPSGPLAAKGDAGGTAFLWKARERAFLARGFRLCGGDQGAFRSPPGPLRGLSAPTSVALAGSFCAYQPKNAKTTNASPLPLFPHSPSKDIGAVGIHLSCPAETTKEQKKKK